jgi:hypothetical protein
MTKLPGARAAQQRRSLGQVAYETHARSVPAVMAAWSELSGIEQGVWARVARTVIAESKKAAFGRVR